MSSRRVERLNEQLRREVAEILQYEVKDPRIGPVTVTGARVTADLQLARLFVVVSGDDEERRETLEGLNAAQSFIRASLSERLELRRAPELRFELDESLAHARRIEELLGEVLPAGSSGPQPDPVDHDAMDPDPSEPTPAEPEPDGNGGGGAGADRRES